jgi:hypothetical protein
MDSGARHKVYRPKSSQLGTTVTVQGLLSCAKYILGHGACYAKDSKKMARKKSKISIKGINIFLRS